MTELTLADMRLLESLVCQRTDDDLAKLINKPLHLVQDFCARLDRKRRRVMNKSPKPPKNKLPKDQVRQLMKETFSDKKARALERKEQRSLIAKEKARKKALRESERRHSDRRVVIEQKKFKIKVPDLTGKVAYRLDHKTIVYAEPGADINLLKKRANIKF